MQFEVIENGASCAQDGGVLPRGDSAEIARANVAGAFSEHLRFFGQAVPGDEGCVDCGIAAGGVFDKEGDIGHLVEKILQHRNVNQRLRDTRFGLADCAHFNNRLEFYAKTETRTKVNLSVSHENHPYIRPSRRVAIA